MCRLWKKQAWPSETMLAMVSSGSCHSGFRKLALYEQDVLHAVPEGGLAFSETLEVPTPFAAADVISKDENTGRIQFHYTIVEVAALAADPATVPQAASDADDVQWVPVRMLRGFPGEEPPTAPTHWQICFSVGHCPINARQLLRANGKPSFKSAATRSDIVWVQTWSSMQPE